MPSNTIPGWSFNFYHLIIFIQVILNTFFKKLWLKMLTASLAGLRIVWLYPLHRVKKPGQKNVCPACDTKLTGGQTLVQKIWGDRGKNFSAIDPRVTQTWSCGTCQGPMYLWNWYFWKLSILDTNTWYHINLWKKPSLTTKNVNKNVQYMQFRYI